MANRITELTAAGTLTGDELLEVSKLSSSVTITGTTISAAAADNSFNDSGSGFVSAGFAVGDRVKVEGFTTSANNLFFGVVASVTAAKMTIEAPEGDAIVDEAAGDSVTITKWTSRRTTGQAIGDLGGGGGGGGGSPLDVEKDGSVVQLDVTTLNFTGAGVTVTDEGGYTVNVDIPGGGSGGGSGGGASNEWEEVYNATIPNPSSEIDIDVSAYDDVIVYGEDITLASSDGREVLLSTDGGSTFYGTNGDYVFMDGDAVKNSTRAIIGHAGTNSGARSLAGSIHGLRGSSFKFSNEPGGRQRILTASTDPVTHIRVRGNPSNMTGGTLKVLGRRAASGGGVAPTITESGTSANLLDDNRGKYQRWTNTSAKTLTVQPNATEAITQDAEFHIRNAATSNLTISAGSGVTINPPAGGTLVLEPQMSATLKRVAEDEFDLIGQTVAA